MPHAREERRRQEPFCDGIDPLRVVLLHIIHASVPDHSKLVQARAEEAPGGFGPELRAMMEDSSKHLSKGRKKRAISVELATPETLAAFTLLASQPLHKTSKVGRRMLAG